MKTETFSLDEQDVIARKLDEYGKNFMQAFDDYESDDEIKNEKNEKKRNGGEYESNSEDDKDEDEDEEEDDEDMKNNNDIENLLKNFNTPKKLKDKILNSKTESNSNGFKKASAREYRLFMSPRVSDILKDSEPKKILFSNIRDEKEEKDEKELINVLAEFEKMEKEVKEIGNTILKETNIRKWQIDKLVELGAKPIKSHRRHIDKARSIKMRVEEVKRERDEELVASGMLRTKGSGIERKKIENAKRKRTEADRGLKISEGKFKNGILYVTPLKKAKMEGGKKNSSERDIGFAGATRSGSKGKRTKTKGKKSKSKKGGSDKKRRKN